MLLFIVMTSFRKFLPDSLPLSHNRSAEMLSKSLLSLHLMNSSSRLVPLRLFPTPSTMDWISSATSELENKHETKFSSGWKLEDLLVSIRQLCRESATDFYQRCTSSLNHLKLLLLCQIIEFERQPSRHVGQSKGPPFLPSASKCAIISTLRVR